MKAKRGAKRSRLTIVAIAIGVIIICLGVLEGIDYTIKNWGGYAWDKEAAENLLGTLLPADASSLEFDRDNQRRGKLGFTFEAPNESIDAFVSEFCEGRLYQGYDPFNAIDTSIKPKGQPNNQRAYTIKMGQKSYYSYSLNTSDNLFGIRCISPRFGGDSGRQVQILVDKTFPDVGLLKMDLSLDCYKCDIPQSTSVPSQKSE